MPLHDPLASKGRQPEKLSFSCLFAKLSLCIHWSLSLQRATGPSSGDTCVWADSHLLPSPSIPSGRKAGLALCQKSHLLSYCLHLLPLAPAASLTQLPTPWSSPPSLGAQMDELLAVHACCAKVHLQLWLWMSYSL